MVDTHLQQSQQQLTNIFRILNSWQSFKRSLSTWKWVAFSEYYVHRWKKWITLLRVLAGGVVTRTVIAAAGAWLTRAGHIPSVSTSPASDQQLRINTPTQSANSGLHGSKQSEKWDGSLVDNIYRRISNDIDRKVSTMNPDLVGLSWEPRCGWQEAAAGGVGARKLILSIIQLHTSLSGNKAAHYLPTQTISEHRGHQHQHGSAPTRGGQHSQYTIVFMFSHPKILGPKCSKMLKWGPEKHNKNK